MKRGWCILHVGTHKTGTTALQRTLLSQHSDLIRSGVLYPFSVLKPGYVAHQPFARALLVEKFREDFPRILKKLDAERAATGVQNVFISSELLESISRDAERIQYLLECLDSYFDNIYVAAVTRAAEKYCLSLYKELSRVKQLSWNFSDILVPYLKDQRISVFYPKIEVTIRHEFNYGLFVFNFAKVFGQDRILFLEYETLFKEGDKDVVKPLVKKLAEYFGLSPLHDFSARVKEGVRVNRSKPLWKATFQYALNRHQWQGGEVRLAEVVHAAFGPHSHDAAAVFGMEKHAETILRSLHRTNVDPFVNAAAPESREKLRWAESLIDQLARSMCPAPGRMEPFPVDSTDSDLPPQVPIRS